MRRASGKRIVSSTRSRGGASFAVRGGWWIVAQVPVLLIAALLPLWTAASTVLAGPPWPWLGLGLIAMGLALGLAGMVALGTALTPYPEPRDHAAHRTDGVYGLVRHPIYSGVILGCLGWALWWQSLYGAGFTLAVALFFDRKAAHEERRLAARYPGYPAYRRRTRKFIPWLY